MAALASKCVCKWELQLGVSVWSAGVPGGRVQLLRLSGSGDRTLGGGPAGPGCCLKIVAATCYQTCRYCDSGLSGNSRQLVIQSAGYW